MFEDVKDAEQSRVSSARGATVLLPIYITTVAAVLPERQLPSSE